MSECVVRMEMPENCFVCPLRLCCSAYYAYSCSTSTKRVLPKPLDEGCNILAVLPEGHGRLVDERELFARCRPLKNFDNPDSLVIVQGAIIQSQTIVPADAERSET